MVAWSMGTACGCRQAKTRPEDRLVRRHTAHTLAAALPGEHDRSTGSSAVKGEAAVWRTHSHSRSDPVRTFD
jgi:hypothetical protein